MGACRLNLVDSRHLEPRRQRAQRHDGERERERKRWRNSRCGGGLMMLTVGALCSRPLLTLTLTLSPIVRRAQRGAERARIWPVRVMHGCAGRLPARLAVPRIADDFVRRASQQHRARGCLRDDADITAAVPQIADDLLQCASRQHWAKARSRCAPASCAGARADRPGADREDGDSAVGRSTRSTKRTVDAQRMIKALASTLMRRATSTAPITQ